MKKEEMREVRTQEPRRIVRATRAKTTQDGTSIHGWCANTLLHDWCRRLSRDAVSTSLVSARSVCAVSDSVVRSVMKGTWLEHHIRATDRDSTLTEQQHVGWELTFVSSRDHYDVLISRRRNTTNIKHVLLPRELKKLKNVHIFGWKNRKI